MVGNQSLASSLTWFYVNPVDMTKRLLPRLSGIVSCCSKFHSPEYLENWELTPQHTGNSLDFVK